MRWSNLVSHSVPTVAKELSRHLDDYENVQFSPK